MNEPWSDKRPTDDPPGTPPESHTVVQTSPPHHLMAGPPVPPTVPPGRIATVPGKVGRYEIGDELARGGMGVVFRARDTELGRDVAVKVLFDDRRGHPAACRRFLAEARITGQLQHPGIPPVFEVGALTDGSPLLAMKLIKGRTLDAMLRERPNPSTDRGRFVARSTSTP